MKTASPHRSRNLAVALVIVLALVVLLSGVVVAYFTQAMAGRKLSDSSLQQAKADELARSALEIIAADLKQEIVNGSTAITFGDTTLYIPKTPLPPAPANAGMLPVRNQQLSGTNPTPIPNLIRISGATSVAAPGAEHPASNAQSTVASGNRRSIPRARWNGHYLMPLKNPASTTLDSTPVDSFTAPNWVFVTAEKGPVVLQSPSLDTNNQKVTTVGRYAYAIFDESGLLDANVAGYPGVLPAAAVHPVDAAKEYGYSPKGILAFADLTQLFPSTSALTANQKQLLVDNIVGWRNYASAKSGGSFDAFTFENNGATYSDSLLANRNGFLRIAETTTLPQTRTDQAFLSRQQMLDFVLRGLATPANTADLQNIVQYLGTFSRAVTSPMWSPTKDAPVAAYAYKTNADDPTWSDPRAANNGQNPNRNIPNVRFAAPAVIMHYNDDGSQTSYAVDAGDSLVRHRFSLAKLAWLKTGPNGPDYSAFKSGLTKAEMDAAIASCFGLEWQPNTIGSSAGWSNAGWKYVAATSTAVHIKTLGEIATENREPNFFEMLKAGILDGSLGRDPGVLNAQVTDGNNVTTGTPGNLCNLLDVYEADPNLQILQIGANIIDQADPDSYPTSVYLRIFDLTSRPPCDELTVNTVYGTENLPCLSRLGGIALADPAVVYSGTTIVTRGTLKFWLQPELWNPHQVPAGTPVERPSNFRAYAYGSVYGGWRSGNSTTVTKGTPVFYDDGAGSGAITSGSIYFSDPGGLASPFYNKPKILALDTTAIDQSKTAPENLYDPTKWSGLAGDTDHYTGAPKPPNQFAAFSAGSYTNYGPSNTTVSKTFLSNPNLTISLQYLGPDNLYHPYNFMSRIGPVHYTRAVTSNGSRVNGATRWFNVSNDDGLRAACRPDPRTDRFGLARVWIRDWAQNETINSQAGRRIGNNLDSVPAQAAFTFLKAPSDTYFTRNIGLWATNDSQYPFVIDKFASSKAYYADQDGIVRLGDSYRQNDPDINTSVSLGYNPNYKARGPNTGDGCVYYHGDAVVNPASTLASPGTGSAQARRPAILNRPFRSVGELGFAYRDQPFKSLDFWSSDSGDLGLLDLFTPSDQPYVVAGQINLNTAPAPVLQAILAGAAKNDTDLGLKISAADAKTLADMISAELIGTNGPLANRTELAARLETPIRATLKTNVTANANWANKAHAEAPVRALTDVSNSRTWNIMIDLVAQTGTFAPQAPQTAAALNSSFQVLGERRYWMHLAIDRLTGRIIDQQLELVYE